MKNCYGPKRFAGGGDVAKVPDAPNRDPHSPTMQRFYVGRYRRYPENFREDGVTRIPGRDYDGPWQPLGELSPTPAGHDRLIRNSDFREMQPGEAMDTTGPIDPRQYEYNKIAVQDELKRRAIRDQVALDRDQYADPTALIMQAIADLNRRTVDRGKLSRPVRRDYGGMVPGAVGVQDYGGSVGVAQGGLNPDFQAMVSGSDPSQALPTIVNAAKRQQRGAGMSLKDILPNLGMGALAGFGGTPGIIMAGVLPLLQALLKGKGQQQSSASDKSDMARMVYESFGPELQSTGKALGTPEAAKRKVWY